MMTTGEDSRALAAVAAYYPGILRDALRMLAAERGEAFLEEFYERSLRRAGVMGDDSPYPLAKEFQEALRNDIELVRRDPAVD